MKLDAEQVQPPHRDPDHPHNSSAHHTGKNCIEQCGRPAGTWWSPLWCQPCNADRLGRISGQLGVISARAGSRTCVELLREARRMAQK